MNKILLVLLVVSAIMLFIGMILALMYFIIDRYYWRVKKLRAIIIGEDSKIRLLWLTKTNEEKGKFNIAVSGKKAFFYLPQQIRFIGSYNGLVFYENNFHALSFDEKKLQFDSLNTTHPKILKEILDSKLVSELLQNSIAWQDILLISIAVVMVIGMGYLAVTANQHTQILTSIQGNMTAMPETIAKLTMGR